LSDLLVPRSDVGEFRKRYKWMALAAFLAFLGVVVRLFQLQVVDGADYHAIAHENIIRRVSLATTRGVIRDSQGRVLASSRPAYNAFVVPGRTMPSARPSHHAHPDEVDTWPHVADSLRINPEERARFEERIRAACATDEDKSPCWRPLLVREDLPRDIVAELLQHESELVGVEVVSSPVRYYPYKSLGAHLLGYVAEIDADTLSHFHPDGWESMTSEERQKVNPLGYDVGDGIGATGVERAWESYLRGQRGWEKRVVDAHGRYRTGPEADRILDEPRRQDPIPGRDLRLTIDMDLEQAAERAMRGQLSGAVVVTEVKTGRLLALYSKPDFDPDDLAGGGGKARVRETFAKLYTDPLRPLLDKTTSGAFQPGSTFKPFSALAALQDKLVDPEQKERCDGYLMFGRKIFRCAHVHGKVDMREAIAESCNIYFTHVAEAVGMDRLAHMANEFGLGEKTGIGVNPESAGRVPTRSWYALRYRGQFRLGFTLNAAIGQGAMSVTPLQLALAYAALGNGGTLYMPQLVRSVETSDGSIVQDFPPRIRHKAAVRPDDLARVDDALHAVVNESIGTAFPVRDDALDVSGKTGTAQTGYVATKDVDAKTSWYLSQNHAWFAAFSPAKAPEISVVVLIEHGGSGPTIAAPMAMEIVREYERIQAVRAGRPPPRPATPHKPLRSAGLSLHPPHAFPPSPFATPAPPAPAGPP
jgi:penicillin-binding protein 2